MARKLITMNELNQKMLASGESWQITSIDGVEKVVMDAESFASMMTILAGDKNLQERIIEENMDIDYYDSMDYWGCKAEGCEPPEPSDGVIRSEAFLSIYDASIRKASEERNKYIDKDDYDLPF